MRAPQPRTVLPHTHYAPAHDVDYHLSLNLAPVHTDLSWISCLLLLLSLIKITWGPYIHSIGPAVSTCRLGDGVGHELDDDDDDDVMHT